MKSWMTDVFIFAKFHLFLHINILLMSTPPRGSTKDYMLPFLIIIAVGVIVVLLFDLWGSYTGKDTSIGFDAGTPSKVMLNVEAGEVEAYLPAAEAWKIVAAPGTTLSEGERVRTAADASAYLVLEDGTRVTLAAGSEVDLVELRSSFRTKAATIKVPRGTVLIDTTAARSGSLTLESRLVHANEIVGTMLLTVGDDGARADLSVISGGATATVRDPQEGARKTDLQHLIVEAGQTLGLTERRVNLIRIGGELDLVKDTPKEIASSDLYVSAALANVIADAGDTEEAALKGDAEEDVATDVEAVEPAAADTASAVDGAAATTLTAPTITSVTAGQVITTDLLELRGAVSASTAAVEVSANGGAPYQLGGYTAGSATYLYRAKTAFANLAEGENTYSVVAIDADGNRSAAAMIKITYQPNKVDEPVASPAELEEQSGETGALREPQDDMTGVPEVGSSAFAAPTVTSPADGATFTTEPVAFTGTVSAGTTSVEVNGYALTQGFKAGSTSWFYNAKTDYENLKIGENEYEIEAISEAGDRSSVTIKIDFAPAE